MTRYLKVLGLCLVAAFALSAVGASGASAQNGMITSTGPFFLDGTELTETGDQNMLTAFGQSVSCPGSTFRAHKYKGKANEPIPSGSTTFTLVPTYNNPACNAAGLKMTINMNSCDYDVHVGATTGTGDTYGVTTDLNCETSAVGFVDWEIFSSAKNENVKVCTIKIKPALNQGLTGPHLTDETNGHIRLTGTFTGFHVEKEGGCGTETTTVGQYHEAITFTGTNEAGVSTSIGLSHL